MSALDATSRYIRDQVLGPKTRRTNFCVVTSLAIQGGGGPLAPREKWRRWHLAQVFCVGCGRFTNTEALLAGRERPTTAKSVAGGISPLEATWRPAGAMFCIESCAGRTLGDQDFANSVAYRSHSDTKSKSIRNLRSDGPAFHNGLHMSISTPAGLHLETGSTGELLHC